MRNLVLEVSNRKNFQSLGTDETKGFCLNNRGDWRRVYERVHNLKNHTCESITETELNSCTEKEFRQYLADWGEWKNPQVSPIIGIDQYDFVNYMCYLVVSGVDGMLDVDDKSSFFNPAVYYGPQHKSLLSPLHDNIGKILNVSFTSYLDRDFVNRIGRVLEPHTLEDRNYEVNYINYLELSKNDRSVAAWPYNPANDYGHEILRKDRFNYTALFLNFRMVDYMSKINKILQRFIHFR